MAVISRAEKPARPEQMPVLEKRFNIFFT